MSKPSYTSADFTSALLSLLPRGRAWPKELTSVQAQSVSCFAPTFQRISGSAVGMLDDTFPATTVNFLSEWESTLGLPDACAGVAPTVDARRRQVVARFTNSGGQSIEHFTAYAQGLGYAITITQHAPFRMGQSTTGQPLGNNDWFFAWTVNAPLSSGAYGNKVLECELREAMPGHTVLNFNYS